LHRSEEDIMEPFDIVKARENLKKRREEASKERERCKISYGNFKKVSG
jgi:hypothetical protein